MYSSGGQAGAYSSGRARAVERCAVENSGLYNDNMTKTITKYPSFISVKTNLVPEYQNDYEFTSSVTGKTFYVFPLDSDRIHVRERDDASFDYEFNAYEFCEFVANVDYY